MAIAAEIEQLERDGWAALSGPDGEAFYAGCMADDGVMVFPGIVMSKPEALAAIRDAPPWRRFDLAGVRTSVVGETAVITYTAKAEREPDKTYVATMSSVYVRHQGRWRLLLHQQSPEG